MTLVYVGVGLGSYLQIYSDRYGRYSFILYDSLLQTIFGLFSCLSWNYHSFLVARVVYGVGVGICLPLSASYVTEISPGETRAGLMQKTRMFWAVGCVFTCVVCYFMRDSWRLVLLTICLPGIVALVEFVIYGKESLRYLWAQNRKE